MQSPGVEVTSSKLITDVCYLSISKVESSKRGNNRYPCQLCSQRFCYDAENALNLKLGVTRNEFTQKYLSSKTFWYHFNCFPIDQLNIIEKYGYLVESSIVGYDTLAKEEKELVQKLLYKFRYISFSGELDDEKSKRELIIVSPERKYRATKHLEASNQLADASVGYNRKKNTKHRFVMACRLAVQYQIQEFRHHRFGIENRISCEVTNALISKEESHVDHAAPITFDFLTTQFLAENPSLNVSAIEYIVGHFFDLSIRDQFRKFHAENAVLRIVSKEANLGILRKRNRLEICGDAATIADEIEIEHSINISPRNKCFDEESIIIGDFDSNSCNTKCKYSKNLFRDFVFVDSDYVSE
jgi:hypothetical protein